MPCMMMENCCYGQREMTVLKMVKEGLFGECIHAEGGYRHASPLGPWEQLFYFYFYEFDEF